MITCCFKPLESGNEFCDVVNKTYVFFKGKIIATQRKRIMGEYDYDAYSSDPKQIVRYFHSGMIGKEQKKFEKFFEIFSIEICADNKHGISQQDRKEGKKNAPKITILQSDTIKNRKVRDDSWVIHVDSFSEGCAISKRIKDNEIIPAPPSKIVEITKGNKVLEKPPTKIIEIDYFKYAMWLGVKFD